ncbi:hypothetical protein R5R35_014523 [Gryllus longicercus]|uniref:Hermansky-Pudlak syndrome 3 protein n=1 Tax=Gryllus longicercus TaxID=2509291 RepID=A0AAN9YXL2_9ORTH
MVRVMSVHHFVSQDIHTCEDPLAVTTAPPDLLLLALPQHIVDVRDLSKGGTTAFMFPTVDEVQVLVHCCTGNYVATLESKQTRQGKESVYARIYANWDASPHYDLSTQPMRARIAGRVTPSSAQSGTSGLEMIELPLKRLPNALACCQITGNLVLASQMTLTLYHFQVRTHDISRLKFIDFEESPVGLEISFVPWKLELCENVIACMSKESLHVLRVCYGSDKWPTVEETNDTATESSEIVADDQPIDWDEISKNEKQRKASKFVPSSSKHKENVNNNNSGKSVPIVTYLPGIMSGRNNDPCSTGGDGTYRQSPFIIAPPGMNVSSTSPATGWTEESRILHLLQLRIPSVPNTPSLQHECVPNDQFHCLVLKPLYIQDPACDVSTADKHQSGGHPMSSVFSKHLCGVVCLVTTHQEGYLYYFSMDSASTMLQQAACVTVYPFTAPVSCVVLEDCLLHALTDTGLETYTLRIGHYMPSFSPEEANVTPAWAEPVCLVGLRPFLGVEHLLLSNSYLLLLACSESSSNSSLDSQGSNWTLYSLQTPSPLTLYGDIMSVGGMHRWTSPGTYGHLLGEAHLILRVSRALLHWKAHQECAIPYQHLSDRNHMDDLYKESCALLGDYYITGCTDEDWEIAIPCYKLSGLSPIEVVERVKKIDIPEEFVLATKQYLVKGLMRYLKESLLHMNWAESNANFTPAIPSFTNTLLDLFEEHDPDEVSWLTLRSSLLREYATDRVLNIMKKQLCTRLLPKPSDAVALVLLCIQKGSPGQAVAVLDSLPEEQLSDILLSNSSLLFETTSSIPNVNMPTGLSIRTETVLTFSELSVVLMDTKPVVLANILSTLAILTNQKVTLHDILKVFLEYIPSRIGITGSTASLVLQIFLEKYFAWYFTLPTTSYDAPTVEALKILVRSYLSDLQRCDMPNSARKLNSDSSSIKQQNKTLSVLLKQSSILFIDKHLPFLQKMPPFAPSLSKKLMSMQSGKKETEHTCNEDNSQNSESLVKLQALLCSSRLPKECLVEVYQFVQSHPQLYGNLSLQVLCLPAREGATVLMNFCPQVLLQFAKNKFVAEVEWKYLLLLLQRKIYALPDDNVVKPLYVQVMKDCLSHLSTTLPLEEFCKVLPPGTESSYQQFIRVCQQVSHANHILTLIMATGQQLLSTLHL